MSLQTAPQVRREPRPAPGRAVRAAQLVVDDLFGPVARRGFALRYWDGTVDSPPIEPRFTLVLRQPGALRRMLLPPSELSLVEAYLYDDVDIEGPLEATADLGDAIARRLSSLVVVGRLARAVLALPRDEVDDSDHEPARERTASRLLRYGRAHSRSRDRQSVRFHYDVGNDFYSLWLDHHMVYSCGYFERGDEDLDTAQSAKLDLVCRKLRLRPGERFLDIGCGWGGLLIHAAKHYNVHAYGITLSEQQASLARERIDAAGLRDRVEVEVRDYRYIRFDKIASIGMVEHVGLARLPAYFAAAHRVLEPGGLFLNHGIVSLEDARPRNLLDPFWRLVWRRDAFIRKYVFPDGDLVPSSDVIASAERSGFEVRDVESLREHYVSTLRHWVRRLEEHEQEAARLAGQVTYRVWRLYMAAAAHGFRTGRISVIQTLFAKPDAQGSVELPRSRADVYD